MNDEEDALAPMRGLFIGLILAAILWGILFTILYSWFA